MTGPADTDPAEVWRLWRDRLQVIVDSCPNDDDARIELEYAEWMVSTFPHRDHPDG